MIWKLGTCVEFCPVLVNVAPTWAITGNRPGFCGCCCLITAEISQNPFHAPVEHWSHSADVFWSSATGILMFSENPAPGYGNGVCGAGLARYSFVPPFGQEVHPVSMFSMSHMTPVASGGHGTLG